MGQKQRIAIIQNEFAPTGIDGKLLKQSNNSFKLLEINNGSVFCACQLSNFIETLEKVVTDYTPELIFLEASGMADPINIAEILQSEKLASIVQLKQIYCLADAQNYFKGLQRMTRFLHQLIIADTILLNKADLVTHEEKKKITGDIRTRNPHARIAETIFANYPFAEDLKNEITSHLEPSGFSSAGRPELKVAVIRNHQKLSEEQLRQLMSVLLPKSIRMKGIIHLNDGRTVAVQSTFNKWELQPIDCTAGPSEWIVFGELSPTELRQLIKNTSL